MHQVIAFVVVDRMIAIVASKTKSPFQASVESGMKK